MDILKCAIGIVCDDKRIKLRERFTKTNVTKIARLVRRRNTAGVGPAAVWGWRSPPSPYGSATDSETVLSGHQLFVVDRRSDGRSLSSRPLSNGYYVVVSLVQLLASSHVCSDTADDVLASWYSYTRGGIRGVTVRNVAASCTEG